MNILIKLIPIILLSIILYIFVYNIYPQYGNLLASVKKLNQLKNQEEEIKNLKNLIGNLENNANIKTILANKEIVNTWLPIKPEIENILLTLNNLYSSLGLKFLGTDFSLSEQPTVVVSQVIPVKTINFNLKIESSKDFLKFIDSLEKNVRLMKIKRVQVTPEETNLEVETYYLNLNQE